MNGTGYIVRGLGYIRVTGCGEYPNCVINSIPVTIKELLRCKWAAMKRLGIFDENGEGEVVGGIVVMRYGENADKVIHAVKDKNGRYPKRVATGVTFKIAYDRK